MLMDSSCADKILQKMGEGTFGRVLECWDDDAQEAVAVKVVRSTESDREAAMIEVDVLRMLAEKDRMGSRLVFYLLLRVSPKQQFCFHLTLPNCYLHRGCVQLRRSFEYRNHICIVSIL
eukprot:c25203_g1_i13 orf=678-1034(+)